MIGTNRAEILAAAKTCVCGDREEDYGSPENSFKLISDLWGDYLGVEITPKDAALMMALLKVARAKAGNKADNYVDLAGYAACAGEIDGSPRMEKEEEVWEPKVGDNIRVRSIACGRANGYAGQVVTLTYVSADKNYYKAISPDTGEDMSLYPYEFEKV